MIEHTIFSVSTDETRYSLNADEAISTLLLAKFTHQVLYLVSSAYFSSKPTDGNHYAGNNQVKIKAQSVRHELGVYRPRDLIAREAGAGVMKASGGKKEPCGITSPMRFRFSSQLSSRRRAKTISRCCRFWIRICEK